MVFSLCMVSCWLCYSGVLYIYYVSLVCACFMNYQAWKAFDKNLFRILIQVTCKNCTINIQIVIWFTMHWLIMINSFSFKKKVVWRRAVARNSFSQNPIVFMVDVLIFQYNISISYLFNDNFKFQAVKP